MRKYLFSFLLFALSTIGFSTTWVITNTGFLFTPPTITITVGDSVNFKLKKIHSVIEVSLSTWNANGITPLPGFKTTLGGGLVFPNQLTVGTHYYVCQNYGPIGMKGIIIVLNPTGVAENQLPGNISIYPNPSNSKFKLDIGCIQFNRNCNLGFCNVKEEKIYQKVFTNSISEIDLDNQSKGIYFFKIFNGQKFFKKKLS